MSLQPRSQISPPHPPLRTTSPTNAPPRPAALRSAPGRASPRVAGQTTVAPLLLPRNLRERAGVRVAAPHSTQAAATSNRCRTLRHTPLPVQEAPLGASPPVSAKGPSYSLALEGEGWGEGGCWPPQPIPRQKHQAIQAPRPTRQSPPKCTPPRPLRHSGVRSRNPVFASSVQTDRKCTPPCLKSFLEKTLNAHEPAPFPAPRQVPA